MQAYQKKVANKLALASVSVEFYVFKLPNMLHSGGNNMVIHHHHYCCAAAGIYVGIYFYKNAIPLGLSLQKA